MELQWPLIIFSTFVAWASGLYGTQNLFLLKGEGLGAQMKSLIVSVVLLGVGGIAVTFHLQHFERIFNGFGHLTSGITQELIAMAVLVVFMVILFSYLRRGVKVPAWLTICSIVMALVMIFVCAHSYNMPARPAWNNLLQILSLFGAAFILGPGTFFVLDALSKDEAEGSEKFGFLVGLVGAIVGAVLQIVYLISMTAIETTTYAANYFDPTSPTKDVTAVSNLGPFSGDALMVSVVIILACLAAVVFALLGKKKGSRMISGVGMVVCGVVAAMALRCVFYMMGISIYPFY